MNKGVINLVFTIEKYGTDTTKPLQPQHAQIQKGVHKSPSSSL
jgi:hypothetical protein